MTLIKRKVASLLISSRNFDAKRFLREVHKGTSYRDLELGAERLHEAIEHRQDVIKNLVKTHFAKFVNAKSTIDCTLWSLFSLRYDSLLRSRNF